MSRMGGYIGRKTVGESSNFHSQLCTEHDLVLGEAIGGFNVCAWSGMDTSKTDVCLCKRGDGEWILWVPAVNSWFLSLLICPWPTVQLSVLETAVPIVLTWRCTYCAHSSCKTTARTCVLMESECFAITHIQTDAKTRRLVMNLCGESYMKFDAI